MQRLVFAARAAGIHAVCSMLLAALAAIFVFDLWYPSFFRFVAGGQSLFFLVVSVDVVCGPLLTLVLFDPRKPRAELARDLALVGLIQLAALSYGLWTVWQARPLFLVLEVDRFRVIAAPDLNINALKSLPPELMPKWWSGPLIVGLLPIKDPSIRKSLMLEAVAGGRDYSQHPEYYLPYSSEIGLQAIARFKPLEIFLALHPDQRSNIQDILLHHGLSLNEVRFLPVVGREEWIALLDKNAQIVGYIKGDGFINQK